MAETFFNIFKEIRPRQWIKNLIVFASVVFTGKLFDVQLFSISLVAFFVFCASSSAVYVFNDLMDKDKDKTHPFKKFRPIASGKVGIRTSLIVIFLLVAVSLILSFSLSWRFFLVITTFYLLQISYTLYLKNIILLDIMAIAAGFILRVLGGVVATGYYLNIWLFFTVICAALFLATGKRRSELTLLSGWNSLTVGKTRATLSHYSEKMLDVYLSMFANSTWLTYALYSFLAKPPSFGKTIGNLLDESDLFIFSERKWLMLTIPIVLYGIMRYLQLIYEKNQGESPEKILLSDKPLVITALTFGGSLFLILYVLAR